MPDRFTVQCPHCSKMLALRVGKSRERGPEPINPHATADARRRVMLVQQRVARHFGVTLGDIIMHSASAGLPLPRHIAVYVARVVTKCSWKVLGVCFDRDHATVMASFRRAKWLQLHDPRLKAAVDMLIGSVRATASPGGRPAAEQPPEPAAPAAAE